MKADELIEHLEKINKHLGKVSKITGALQILGTFVGIPLLEWCFSSKKSSSGPRRRSNRKNSGA